MPEPKRLFPDIAPFRTDPMSLDARLRRLFRDLHSAFAGFFFPNNNGKGGIKIATVDNSAYAGSSDYPGSTDFGIFASNAATVKSNDAIYLKTGNDWNGVNDIFTSNNIALQLILTNTLNSPYLYFRQSTNTPKKGDAITWSALRPVIPERGSNSNGEWIRFGDGTQICTYVGFVGAHQATWTYPQTFVAPPIVYIQMSNTIQPGWIYVVNITTYSATQVSFWKQYWNGSIFGTATAEPAHCIAIGRWF